jgi:hypothetical protein
VKARCLRLFEVPSKYFLEGLRKIRELVSGPRFGPGTSHPVLSDSVSCVIKVLHHNSFNPLKDKVISIIFKPYRKENTVHHYTVQWLKLFKEIIVV